MRSARLNAKIVAKDLSPSGRPRGRDGLAMRARVFAALLVACAWSRAGLAADDGTANALIRQGAELYKHEDYEGARGAFARAYELEPKPATLFNLALSELNAGHPVEAAAHWREYLTHASEPAPKLESARTKWLPRAESQIARIDVFAPAGAQVFVDGTAQEPAPATTDTPNAPSASIAIAAGEHDVSARQGTAAETQHVAARGGELVELHFQRVPEAPAPALPIGWAAAADTPVTAREGSSHPERIVALALGAGALIAAGVGVAFDVAAQKKASDAQGTRNALAPGSTWTNLECTGASASAPLCTQLKSDVDTNRGDWMVSRIAYVGAGVLGVASVASWIWWRPKSAAFAARPTLDARSAGFVLDGQW